MDGPADTGDPAEEGVERMGPLGAQLAGERVRDLADAEEARVEAEEAAEAERAAAAEAEQVVEPHPLEALGVEPVTDEALEALGEQAGGYRPCPFCDGYGAVDPDNLIEALPTVIERLAPFPASTVFVRCGECDGWGSVLTGGRTGDNGIQPCPKCHSHGYIDTRENAVERELEGAVRLTEAERERFGLADPFTLAPPDGVPPAAGMEWDSEAGRWGYPARTTA